MDILCGEPALYRRQREVYDAAYAGERNGYDLIRWAKSMNVCSLRQRLYYHGREIVFGGDAYAHVWETVNLTPCDILKVPHHGSLASTSRKLLEHLRPKTAVVTVAARRPDERPHPYIVSLLREYAEEVYFTDAGGKFRALWSRNFTGLSTWRWNETAGLRAAEQAALFC